MEDTKRIGGPETHLSAEELAWHERAACLQADPELFFPVKGQRTTQAKAICGTCAVREACKDYALANDERYGVWGGLTEQERETLLGKRKTRQKRGGS